VGAGRAAPSIVASPGVLRTAPLPGVALTTAFSDAIDAGTNVAAQFA
jgi:hypothetical protein